MRLLELAQTSHVSMRDLAAALGRQFDLERVGGDTRIYQVGDRLGVIFLLNNSLRGVGLIWSRGSTFVQSVCVWNHIDFDAAPDVMVDLPQDATLDQIIDPLVKFIKQPRVGVVESFMLEDEAFQPSYQKPRRFDPDSVPDESPAEAKPEPETVVLMGRKADGTLFEIPGVDEMNAKLTQMLQKQNHLKGEAESGLTMEEQYKLLDKKVDLVAGGKSQFVKSLLITGMPSAGKTFRVMQKIKELGLKEGDDYIVKKGKITPHSLYRVFIEQIEGGLAIFDDCDSVVKYDDAVNMLKGALDTDEVREVSYDVKGLLNTGAMPKEKRDRIQVAMSRILRNRASLDDIRVLDVYRNVKTRMPGEAPATQPISPKPKTKGYDTSWLDDDDAPASNEGGSMEPTPQEMSEAEDWVMNNLPNKIDFQGRVIFISNMSEEEWSEIGDGAILTRAFHQNMYFPDAEMLDYIDTIKQHIKAPKLSEQDKQEVIDYVRELWLAGKIHKPINFRLIQQAFDLFLMNDWRSLVANIG